MVKVDGDERAVEAALAAGEVLCPDCGVGLGGWGRARARRVRVSVLDRVVVRLVSPRRGRCRGCGRTHVLVAGALVGGLRDGLEVVRAALMAWRPGVFGFRRVVEQYVDRAFSTVRGWIRAVARGSSWWAREHFGDLIPASAAGRG